MAPKKSADDETSQRDEQALQMRGDGRSFVAIARQLGYDGVNQANEAFNRALRRKSAAERKRLRGQELARLDGMGEQVRAHPTMAPNDIALRLGAVERLRSQLLAD